MLQKQWETFQSTTAYQTAELERQMERISLAVGRGARRLVLAVGDSLAGLLDTVASVAEKIPDVFGLVTVTGALGAVAGEMVSAIGDAFVALSVIMISKSVVDTFKQIAGQASVLEAIKTFGSVLGSRFNNAFAKGIMIGRWILISSLFLAFQAALSALEKQLSKSTYDVIRSSFDQPEAVQEAVGQTFAYIDDAIAANQTGFQKALHTLTSQALFAIDDFGSAVGKEIFHLGATLVDVVSTGANWGEAWDRQTRISINATKEAADVILNDLIPGISEANKQTLRAGGSIQLTKQQYYELVQIMRERRGYQRQTYEEWIAGEKAGLIMLSQRLELETELSEKLQARGDLLDILYYAQLTAGSEVATQLAALTNLLLEQGALSEETINAIVSSTYAIQEAFGQREAQVFLSSVNNIAQALGQELPRVVQELNTVMQMHAETIDYAAMSWQELNKAASAYGDVAEEVAEAQQKSREAILDAVENYLARVEEAEESHAEQQVISYQEMRERQMDILRDALEKRRKENETYRENEAKAEEDYNDKIADLREDAREDEEEALRNHRKRIEDAYKSYDKSRLKAEKDLQYQIQKVQEDAYKRQEAAAAEHAAKMAQIAQDIANMIANAQQTLMSSLSDIATSAWMDWLSAQKNAEKAAAQAEAEYREAKKAAAKSYYNSVAAAQAQANKARVAAARDYHRAIEEIERDHARTIGKLIRTRDAIALIEERESYKERKEEALKSHQERLAAIAEQQAESMAQAAQQYQQQLAEIEMDYRNKLANIQTELDAARDKFIKIILEIFETLRKLPEGMGIPPLEDLLKLSPEELMAELQKYLEDLADLPSEAVEIPELQDIKDAWKEYLKTLEEIEQKRIESTQAEIERYNREREEIQRNLEERIADLREHYERERAEAEAAFQEKLADLEHQYQEEKNKIAENLQKRLDDLEEEFEKEREKREEAHQKRLEDIEREKREEWAKEKEGWQKRSEELRDQLTKDKEDLLTDLADTMTKVYEDFQADTAQIIADTLKGTEAYSAWIQRLREESSIPIETKVKIGAVTGEELEEYLNRVLGEETVRTLQIDAQAGSNLASIIDILTSSEPFGVAINADISGLGLLSELAEDGTEMEIKPTVEKKEVEQAIESVETTLDNNQPEMKFSINRSVLHQLTRGAIINLQAAIDGETIQHVSVPLEGDSEPLNDDLVDSVRSARNYAQRHPVTFSAILSASGLGRRINEIWDYAQAVANSLPPIIFKSEVSRPEVKHSPSLLDTLIYAYEAVANKARQLEPIQLRATVETPSRVPSSVTTNRITSINIFQQDWQFGGSFSEVDKRELMRLARESAFEGISEVIAEAL